MKVYLIFILVFICWEQVNGGTGGTGGTTPACDRSKCRKVYNCPYGEVYDLQKCCKICGKGPGDKCGKGMIACGNRMECKKGYCSLMFRPEDQCPNGPVYCTMAIRPGDLPTNCGNLGYTREHCSCKYVCRKGLGEVCGSKVGYVPCGTGLYCKGEITTANYYQPGVCASNGPNCVFSRRPCFYKIPEMCKYGLGSTACNVCKECLRGPNEACGSVQGKIDCGIDNGRQLLCKNGKCQHKECDLNSCPRYFAPCKYGSIKDLDNCCTVCRSGPGGRCGKGYIKCGYGMNCLDGYCVLRNKPVDICSGGRLRCPKKPFCRVFRCRYGVGPVKCKCCHYCYGGTNSVCGNKPRFTPCGKGFYCYGEVETALNYRSGKCLPNEKCPSYLPKTCSYTMRPEMCRYGLGTAACQACQVCLKGPTQRCGSRYPYIGCGMLYGVRMICKGEKYENGVFTPGICEAKKCDISKCPKYRRRCFYGEVKDLDNCCNTCGLSPGNKCGPGIIKCGRGMVCRSGYCVLVDRPSDKCRALVLRCPRIIILPPRLCPCGGGTHRCLCRPACFRGLGEVCGSKPRFTRCGTGLYCKGEVNTATLYRPGRCAKKGDAALCAIASETTVCNIWMPEACQYGRGNSPCCDNVCLQGPGRQCGCRAPYLQCGVIGNRQMVCVGESGSGSSYKPGYCKVIPCNRRNCRPAPRCRYGIVWDIQNCCKNKCGQAPGAPCGPGLLACGNGMKCLDGYCILQNKPYNQCPNPPKTLGLARNCQYGHDRVVCHRNAVCLLGPGKVCGSKPGYVPCGKNFYCRNELITSTTYSPGKCAKRGFALVKKDNVMQEVDISKYGPCQVRCDNVKCPQMRPEFCQYGMGTSPCSCCQVCLMGPYETCGFVGRALRYYPCGTYKGRRLRCVGEGFDQNGRYKPGVCRFGPLTPTTRPGTTKPCTTRPGTTKPCTTMPGTTKPCTTRPVTTKPCTTRPATTKPCTTRPATTKPCTASPSITKPGNDYYDYQDDYYYDYPDYAYYSDYHQSSSKTCTKVEWNEKFFEAWRKSFKKAVETYQTEVNNLKTNSKNYKQHQKGCSSSSKSEVAQEVVKSELKLLKNELEKKNPSYTYEHYLQMWLEQHPKENEKVCKKLKVKPKKPIKCKNKPDCRLVRCGYPRGCKIGVVTPPCKCCPQCIREAYDPCTYDQECAPGFQCKKAVTPYNTSLKPIKRCVLRKCVSCSRVLCAAIQLTCPFGKGTDHCGCCPVCNKGAGKLCGGPKNIYGKCGPGLSCVINKTGGRSYTRAYDSGACQTLNN